MKEKRNHCIRIFYAALFLFFFASSTVFPQRSLKEAELLPDAETAALAETGCARQGLAAFLYNPASVSLLPSFSFLLNHKEGLFNNKTESIGFGLPLGKSKFVLSGSFSLNYFMDFLEYTETGSRDMDYFFFTGGVGLGRELFRFNRRQNRVTAGLGLKFVHSRMAEETFSRPLLDAGFQAHFRLAAFGWRSAPGNNFTLGFSLLNLGYGIEESSMPTGIRAGLLYRLWPFLSLCADFVRDDTERIHAGLEYGFRDFLFLRAGYRFFYDNFWLSAGMALKYAWKGKNSVKVNYAFEPIKELGYGHSVSVEYARTILKERESVPVESRIKTEPALFIPDLSGKKKLKISMETDKPGRSRIFSWQVLIYSLLPQKKLFRTIRGKDAVLPERIFWDGRGSDGSLPRIGEELGIVLELADKNAEKWLSNEERTVTGLELHKQERTLSFTLSSSVLFEKNSAGIREKAGMVLDQIAEFLKANEKYRLEIAVFSDETGGEKFNLDMCAKQAQSLRVQFVVKGIDQKRINARGFGMARPVASSATDEGREKNRRAEFRLISGK